MDWARAIASKMFMPHYFCSRFFALLSSVRTEEACRRPSRSMNFLRVYGWKIAYIMYFIILGVRMVRDSLKQASSPRTDT